MVTLYARDGVTIWVGWCHYPDYMVSLCGWDSDTILSRLFTEDYNPEYLSEKCKFDFRNPFGNNNAVFRC